MTVDEVLAGCPNGPAAGTYALRLKAVLRPADGDPASALAVWLTDHLLAQAPDCHDGVWLLAAAWGDRDPAWLLPWVSGWAAAGHRPAHCATLTSGRFFSLPCSPVFDLATGGAAAGHPEEWLETRAFNLNALYALCRGKSDRCEPRPPPGPTPTPSPPPS